MLESRGIIAPSAVTRRHVNGDPIMIERHRITGPTGPAPRPTAQVACGLALTATSTAEAIR